MKTVKRLIESFGEQAKNIVYFGDEDLGAINKELWQVFESAERFKESAVEKKFLKHVMGTAGISIIERKVKGIHAYLQDNHLTPPGGLVVFLNSKDRLQVQEKAIKSLLENYEKQQKEKEEDRKLLTMRRKKYLTFENLVDMHGLNFQEIRILLRFQPIAIGEEVVAIKRRERRHATFSIRLLMDIKKEFEEARIRDIFEIRRFHGAPETSIIQFPAGEFMEVLAENDFAEIEKIKLEDKKKELPLLPPSHAHLISLLYSGMLDGEIENDEGETLLIKGSTVKRSHKNGKIEIEKFEEKIHSFNLASFKLREEE